MEGSVASSTSLSEYKKMFSEARDLTQDARKESIIDGSYYHGYQWTTDEKNALKKRKQPDNVYNWFRIVINGSLGVLKMGKTDPRAYPRTPKDEDSASVASKTLRFIADYNNFDQMRIDCALDFLVPGTCAVLIEVDEDKRPTLTQIRWEEFFYDPRSRRPDFADARYMGVAKWMYSDDVASMYPDAKKDVESMLEGAEAVPLDESFQDRPGDARSQWVDARRRRIMVVELYHREAGKWMRCVFHSGGILEKGVSPYEDEKKRPDCAIVAQSCYVDEDNNRIGFARDLRGPQDGINKRSSKILHLLNNRQMVATEAGFEADADLVRAEAAKPDGVIPYGWAPVPTNDMTAGQFSVLAGDTEFMQRLGPSAAVLGRQGNDSQSGRAKLVDQQAGLTEQAVIFGGIEAWELRVYRKLWCRSKQFMTAPDYVRITDDMGAPEFIGINQPQMGPPQIVMGPQGLPMIQPTILGYENQLAELDVDINLDTVPDTAGIQHEQFEKLVELAGIYGPQEVPFDDLLEVSDLPMKRELIEKRKTRKEEAAQGGQQQQQMQEVGFQAELEEKQSKTALNHASAQAKIVGAQVDLQTAHVNAFQQGHQLAQPDTAAG